MPEVRLRLRRALVRLSDHTERLPSQRMDQGFAALD